MGKKLVKTDIGDYSFNALAKEITFSGIDGLTLDQILLITNVTDNTIIYNFAAKGGTLITSVLTLDYDTTSMNDTDEFQIWIWVSDENEPIGSTKILESTASNVVGEDDSTYKITNTKKLVIDNLFGSGEYSSSGGSVLELWYDPNGDLSSMILIGSINFNGNYDNIQIDDSLNTYTGDTTNRIVMRRRRLDGGIAYVSSSWRGYEI